MGEHIQKTRTENDRIFNASFVGHPADEVVSLVIHSQLADADTREVLIGHTDSVSVRVDDPIYVHSWVECGGNPAEILTTLEFLKAVSYSVRAKARSANIEVKKK